jgi:hypothetical protein
MLKSPHSWKVRSGEDSVELLAGDIELSAPAAGTGLVVTVRLPFAGVQIRGRTAA